MPSCRHPYASYDNQPPAQSPTQLKHTVKEYEELLTQQVCASAYLFIGAFPLMVRTPAQQAAECEERRKASEAQLKEQLQRELTLSIRKEVAKSRAGGSNAISRTQCHIPNTLSTLLLTDTLPPRVCIRWSSRAGGVRRQCWLSIRSISQLS